MESVFDRSRLDPHGHPHHSGRSLLRPRGAEDAGLVWRGRTAGNAANHARVCRVADSLAFLAITSEFLGGLGLIAGLLGRVAAIGICIAMVSAIVMVHWRHGLFLNWFG